MSSLTKQILRERRLMLQELKRAAEPEEDYPDHRKEEAEVWLQNRDAKPLLPTNEP